MAEALENLWTHPSHGGSADGAALERACEEMQIRVDGGGADRPGGRLGQAELQGQGHSDVKVPGVHGEEQRARWGWKMRHPLL